MKHCPRAFWVGVLLFSPLAAAEKLPEFSEAKRLYAAREYARAVEMLQAAAAKAPMQARVHYLLGLAQTRLGHYAQAEQSLRLAQRLDPKIGFTSRAKFETKLARVERLAAAAKASAPQSPPPTTHWARAAPSAAPQAPRIETSPSPDKDGPPPLVSHPSRDLRRTPRRLCRPSGAPSCPLTSGHG